MSDERFDPDKALSEMISETRQLLSPKWTKLDLGLLEAALADRIDALNRLEAQRMNYASEVDKAKHVTACFQVKLEIRDIVSDIEKAKGETS